MQDVQVYATLNKDATITPRTIEEAFDSLGLSVVANNDMNIPFEKRFKNKHYKVYNLAMFMHNELSFKLIKKYPSFGALTPLTMSIYTKGEKIYIATLTQRGMARAAGISMDDADLKAYSQKIRQALQKALPRGSFEKLPFHGVPLNESLQVNFTSKVELDGRDVEEYIEDFEAEFEAEMEPLGFLLPNFTNVQEELFEEYNYNAYDFYHTYSICKFDVIYPVSKQHPQAGAWAPCSFYLYKKKGENEMHMGFLSVENWIRTLNIQDETSTKPLREAQNMIIKILEDLSE
jgi:uncharacterized protein (DUF302 family)